ncbi:hypothetical protein BDR26DRAFT_861489, partial [Obelidium mucronatum]
MSKVEGQSTNNDLQSDGEEDKKHVRQPNSHLLAPISLSLNPTGTIFLGYETNAGSMYMALSTGTFTKPAVLPVPPETLATLIIHPKDGSVAPQSEISAETMSIPVNEQEWVFSRTLVNEARPDTFPADLTYKQFLVNAVTIYLDHFLDYEAVSFPMAFRKDFKSFVDQDKGKRGTFGDYVSAKFRESEKNPMVLDWVAWAGTILHAIKVLGGNFDPRLKEFGLVSDEVGSLQQQQTVDKTTKPTKNGKTEVPLDLILLFLVLGLGTAWVVGWIN